MPSLDPESLLAPLGASDPCGPDLEYDPLYLEMLAAGAGKPEQQYGETLLPAEDPDWRLVHERALALAERTRDLRVAVWLVRSGARLHGLAHALAGLELVSGLLTRHWAQVHPRLDADDHDDPTMRLNALAPLVHPAEALADLRACRVGTARAGLGVRDVELAVRAADPLPAEAVPTESGVVEAVALVLREDPSLAATWRAGADAVAALSRTLDEHIGAAHSIDFAPLSRLLGALVKAAALATGSAGLAGAEGAASGAESGAQRAGELGSREDAVRALERISDWIERNEPSNPAPLLIRRAQRLMSKNFIEIMRDLVPEGVNTVEKLAGSAGK